MEKHATDRTFAVLLFASNIYRTSIDHLSDEQRSNVRPTSIEMKSGESRSDIHRTCMEHLSGERVSSVYRASIEMHPMHTDRTSIEHLAKICRRSGRHRVCGLPPPSMFSIGAGRARSYRGWSGYSSDSGYRGWSGIYSDSRPRGRVAVLAGRAGRLGVSLKSGFDKTDAPRNKKLGWSIFSSRQGPPEPLAPLAFSRLPGPTLFNRKGRTIVPPRMPPRVW